MTTEQEYDLIVPTDEEMKAHLANTPDDLEDVELEIEDDTPPEDQGRTPMPKPLLEELEADELDEYDGKVKERLKQMRKVWHDERRAKEEAFREHQAAVEYARRVREENQRLQQTLQMGSQEYANMLQHSAQLRVDAATRAYKEAYDSGDSDELVKAQQALQEANILAMQAKNFKVPSLQQEPNEVQPEAKAPVQQRQPAPQQQLDPKLEAWQERNPWYGMDDEMTASALGLHEKLRREGEVEIGSDEYYKVLDETIRRRFPENFQTEQRKQAQPKAPVVAPATRSTSPKRIRLTKSQVALAKKLGITPEQYALEVKRMESGNE